MDGAGRLTKVLPDHDTQRRQTVEPSYRPNGAVYVASPAQARARGFWSPATRGFVMPVERSTDIDSAADLNAVRASSRPGRAGHRMREVEDRPGHRCFVIAEAGVNHNGSLELALRLVDAAADSGATR